MQTIGSIFQLLSQSARVMGSISILHIVSNGIKYCDDYEDECIIINFGKILTVNLCAKFSRPSENYVIKTKYVYYYYLINNVDYCDANEQLIKQLEREIEANNRASAEFLNAAIMC